jgi:hypothetical protein
MSRSKGKAADCSSLNCCRVNHLIIRHKREDDTPSPSPSPSPSRLVVNSDPRSRRPNWVAPTRTRREGEEQKKPIQNLAVASISHGAAAGDRRGALRGLRGDAGSGAGPHRIFLPRLRDTSGAPAGAHAAAPPPRASASRATGPTRRAVPHRVRGM